jgi:hypothetical protein
MEQGKNLSFGGRTQAFWYLKPGESHTLQWNELGLYDYYYVNPDPKACGSKPFKVIPGVYRVIIGDWIKSEPQVFAISL